MPNVSAFFGIVIRMYYLDHGRPHVHALHAGRVAVIDAATGEAIRGRLGPSAHRLVREWLDQRRGAVLGNWERAREGEPMERIPGLDDDAA